MRDHHRIRDAPPRPQVRAHVGVLKDRVGQVGARFVCGPDDGRMADKQSRREKIGSFEIAESPQ